MTDVFRTFIIPADKAAIATKIVNALGYPEKGMFVKQVGSGEGLISSGYLRADSPLLGTPAELLAAASKADETVTLADCQALLEPMDLTDADPYGRMQVVLEEVAQGATAEDWVQPTGAHDAYPRDAVVKHGGKAWRSLIDANVWAPGTSGWRLLWAGSSTPPEWVQPTGAHDAYKKGDLVTYKGKVYRSLIDANVWAPDAYPQGWELVT